MCLSLCACGGTNAPERTEATEATTEITEPENTQLTKDEMVATAEILDCATVLSDFETNPVNAKDKYTGTVFTFEGYVEKIFSLLSRLFLWLLPTEAVLFLLRYI